MRPTRQLLFGSTSLLLLCMSYPPLHWGWLAWFALAPIGIAILSVPSAGRAFLLAFPFGLAWVLTTIDWIRTAYTSPESRHWQSMFLAWLLLGLLGGMCFACFCAGHWLLSRRLLWPSSIALPVAWTASESLMDSICRVLAGTTSDTIRIALTQTNCTIAIQTAELGGAFAVGWLVASVNGCLVDLKLSFVPEDASFALRRRGVFISCLGIGLMLSYGVLQCTAATEHTIRVGVVPVNFTPKALSELPPDVRDSDLLVWPEHAWHEAIRDIDRPRLHKPAGNAVQSFERPMLIGFDRITTHPLALYNSVGLFSSAGILLDSGDKRFLGPVNEALPALGRLLIPEGTIAGMPYTAAGRSGAVLLPEGPCVGIGVCHDVCFPEWSQDLCRSENVDFLVTCASEGFDRSGKASRFTLACAQLRAVESRRATVRCVRRGISTIIDGNGRILHNQANQPFVVETPLDDRSSLFVDYGTTPFAFAVTVIILVSHNSRRNVRQPTQSTMVRQLECS